jgi:hypothetical protein
MLVFLFLPSEYMIIKGLRRPMGLEQLSDKAPMTGHTMNPIIGLTPHTILIRGAETPIRCKIGDTKAVSTA